MSTLMYSPLFLIDPTITAVVRVDRKVIVPHISRAIPHHHPIPLHKCTRRVGSVVTDNSSKVLHCKVDAVRVPTPFARSFRRRFFACRHAMKHPNTNIVLSLFRTLKVLKRAAVVLTSVYK